MSMNPAPAIEMGYTTPDQIQISTSDIGMWKRVRRAFNRGETIKQFGRKWSVDSIQVTHIRGTAIRFAIDLIEVRPQTEALESPAFRSFRDWAERSNGLGLLTPSKVRRDQKLPCPWCKEVHEGACSRLISGGQSD